MSHPPPREESSSEHSKSLVHLFLWPLVTATCIIFACFHHLHITPTPAQHISTKGGEFSEGRTKAFLTQLEGLGPKLLGTGANEVGATALLISELLRIPTSPDDGNDWDIESGLSTPYTVVRNHQDKVPEVSNGCVCPDPLRKSEDFGSSLSFIIQSVHRRLTDAIPLCADEAVLNMLGTDFEWLKQLRHALRIPSKGCLSTSDWAAAEMYLRYVKDSYQVELPAIQPSQISQLIEHDKHLWIRLQNLAAGTVIAQHQLAPLLEHNICTETTALQMCSEGLSFRIERFVLQKEEPELKGALSFLDISLSHQYSGDFIMDIPKAGFLTNVYRNLTTLATRLLPLNLILKNDDKSVEISDTFTDLKQMVIKEYKTFEIVPVIGSSVSSIQQLTNSLGKLTSISLSKSQFRKQLPPSLMLASHYDTAVSSPGGADAGTGISVALEVLRNVLHRRDIHLNRPLMLVLNGGEENVLPAAHGFVTQHPWINDVTEVFNLEAAGNWGNENLLRAGHHSQRLIELYQRVVQLPHASSGSHEAFEAGLVPGLTDFQFYRDIAGLEGFDFAYGTGGYYYHTPMDQLENIQPGSIQHYGDTVSALTFALLGETVNPSMANMSARQIRRFRKQGPEMRDAYFDILGRSMIIIPSQCLHSPLLVAALVSVVVLIIRSHTRLWKGNSSGVLQSSSVGPVLRFLCTFATALGANAAFAYCLHLIGWDMCWFSNPMWIPLLYTPLTIVVILESLRLTARSSLYGSGNLTVDACKLESENFLASIIFWTVLFAISVIFQSRIAYIPLVILVGSLAGRLIGYFIMIFFRFDPTSSVISVFTLIGHLLSMLVTAKPYALLIDHLGPVFGRVSPPETPDVILAALTTVYIFTILPLVFYCPFSRIVFDKSALRFTRLLLWCFYLPLCLSFVLSHPPFTSTTPQRVDAIHFIARAYGAHGELLRAESGLTIQGSDSIGFSSAFLDRIEDAVRPHWSSPVHGASHFDSFHNNNKSSSHFHSTDDLKRFDVIRDPQHTFFRYPQGALIRKYAGNLIHVYPDLLPPFIDVNSKGLHLSDVPGNAGWDPSWQLMDPFFVTPDVPLPYSSRHRPPQLKWDIEPRSNGIARIHLNAGGAQRATVCIPAKQPVIAWSFSPKLPLPREECDCYGTLFGGGVASPMSYDFWVDFDTKHGDIFSIAISANYFDILTPPLRKVLELEKTLKEEGIFTTTTTSVGELGYWKIAVENNHSHFQEKNPVSIPIEASEEL